MTLSRLAAAAALALMLSASAGAQPASQIVTIGVFSYGFTPSPIRLRAGQPVTLVFVNQGSHGHDFTAPQFFASSRFSAGAAPGGKIPLAGHETKSITLTPRAGTYRAHCSHFLHSSMGMTTTIVVS